MKVADTDARPEAFAPQRGSFQRRRFESIEAMAATVRALRPEGCWEAAQLSRGAAHGRVVAFAGRKSNFTAVDLVGTVEFHGIVADQSIILGVALAQSRLSRQWFEPGTAGTAVQVTPGQTYNAVFFERASYIAMDISRETLLAEAELAGVNCGEHALGVSRILPAVVEPGFLRWISSAVHRLHEGQDPTLLPGARLEGVIMAGLIAHLGSRGNQGRNMSCLRHATIVRTARDYIHAHLGQPIQVDELCRVAGVSRATLFRAFDQCLGESPLAYVLQLRLNRIRADLATPHEARQTVTTVSHKWGVAELGRMAERYRAQFGESPSDTLRKRSGGAMVRKSHATARVRLSA